MSVKPLTRDTAPVNTRHSRLTRLFIDSVGISRATVVLWHP